MNNYFSHDSNARNSDKLIPLRMKLGAEGYGIYFMLLERLRDEKDYMSIKDYNMLAFDLRVDASKVKSVIEDFRLFVFTEDGKYFYSEGFKKRMDIKDIGSIKRSEAGKKGAAKRWGSNCHGNADGDSADKNGNAVEKNSNAIAMSSKNIASKVKESKEKNIYNSGVEPVDNIINYSFDYFWLLYPKKVDREKTESAFHGLVASGVYASDLCEAVGKYKKTCEPKFIKQPFKFLSDGFWRQYIPKADKACPLCKGAGYVEKDGCMAECECIFRYGGSPKGN
jgi:uncharacterized protein YdaU (DUF1376 family)